MIRAALAVLALVVALPASAFGHGVPQIPMPKNAPPGWLVAPETKAGCPTQVDPASFATAADIYADDAKMASFGERPTGSPNHRRFVNWLDARLHRLPGATVESVAYPINRWTAKRTALRARPDGGRAEPLANAGPLPYAKPTPKGGVAAKLLYLPPDTAISAADVKGKIVIRDGKTLSIPKAAFAALEWFTYDPEQTLTKGIGGTYEREDAGQSRVDDLLQAGAGGAAAVVFVHGFPRAQKDGQYAPYEGVEWPVPAVFMGIDEGTRLKAIAAKGGSARVTLDATFKTVKTRMPIVTLRGLSDEKILVQSHTDGINAVWDNGPIAMLAMADWLAKIGPECRPRTIQFAFTTGHLYQHLVPPDRDGSAEQLADRLDREYNNGKVALVVAMEHMGAKGFDPVARGDGLPGRKLVPSKLNEPTSIFMGESPALIADTLQVVQRRDVRETIALRGADLPGLQIPPHDSFGGEGNPYLHHLIPTVALITSPWTLFDPHWSVAQTVDPELMYEQTLAFTDLVQLASTQPRQELAGAYTGYRETRSLTCGTALEALGLVRHCTVP